MWDPLSILGMLAGLLCAAGAAATLHRLAAEAVLDRMLAALGDPGAAAERRRSRWRMLGGVLGLFAGIALLALSRWTPLAFALAALGVLVATPGATLRGGLLVLAVGVLVWRLDQGGLWRHWVEPALLELGVLAGIAAMVSAVLLRHAAWRPPAVPVVPTERMTPLRLVPAYRQSPLRRADADEPVDAATLGLGAGLVARIAAWDAGFQPWFDNDDRGVIRFPDLATEQAWFAEGCAIAGAIQRDWGGAVRNDLSGLDTLEQHARRGLDAGAPMPLAEAIAMAPRCGVAEIREAFQRLDILALSVDQAMPDDLAALEHEARFLSLVLAHVAPRYGPEVEAGLATAHTDVRAWVAEVTPAAGRPPGR
ncbi:hypothetical protein [Roseomonas sp. CECT 9278]|uniref:hypothetical protein n=1 Tax=Roseomonas sp. CECT 9278 TaxID=2845823 RepID=UPI001E521EDE|nr:hypothetical protein [Roseomonas sp. CECT 9278]CAH0137315.1 hypothetical protein ROS9278_00387 [Roseomonas sp. CECT 9278]